MTSSARARQAPRVLHVTTTDVSLALLLGPQLRAFAQAGYEVIGVSAPGPYVAELTASGIAHHPLRHATRGNALHRDVAALAELRSLFVRLRPDVVHTHNPKPGVYGRLAARAAGVPIVVNTVHGLYAQRDDRLAKRVAVYGLERLAASCSAAELVQSSEDLDTLRSLGVPESRLHLLGNGVDLNRFDPARVSADAVARLREELCAGPDDVICGAVGRLVWEKGYRELFAAADTVRRQRPFARFVVAGGHDSDKADSLTPGDLADAGARSGVVFLGQRADVETLYAAMDIYILASHREGFPRSAMEAAAMGLPAVVTDIRGCRQVVDHGLTGLIVPARNAPALADALLSLVDDADLRRRMGHAARAKAAAEFDDRLVIDKTLAVYADLLGRSRRSMVERAA